MGKNLVEKMPHRAHSFRTFCARRGNRHPHGSDAHRTATGARDGVFTIRSHEGAAKVFSVSYINHDTIQIGFENADDHRYLPKASPGNLA